MRAGEHALLFLHALLLLLLSLSYSRELTADAIIVSWALSGAFVWIFGSDSVHCGASGIVYGLIGFLLTAGIVRRDGMAAGMAVAVLCVYSGTLFSLLRFVPGVSWSGHASGFASGVLTAWATRKTRR